MRSDKKRKKGKRWLKIIGIVILLLVIGAGRLRLFYLPFTNKRSRYDAPTD